MTLNIAQDGIEIGIVTRDAGPMLEFYRDILGLEFEENRNKADGRDENADGQWRTHDTPEVLKLSESESKQSRRQRRKSRDCHTLLHALRRRS